MVKMVATPRENTSILASYFDFSRLEEERATGLWRHVDAGPWCRGHGGCSSHTRHDTSHAQARYLGGKPLVQENVSGGQVAVDDGRRSLVEVGEAAGHVVEHKAL